MVNQSQEKACAALRDLLKDDTLTHVSAVCESADTVMTEDGMIHSADALSCDKGNLSPDELVELGRMRKELVLGLNGYETHSLSQANKIIDRKITEYPDTENSSRIVRFIKEQF